MTKWTDFDRGTWGNPPEYYDKEWSNSDLENVAIHNCELCHYEPVTEKDEDSNMWICKTCLKVIDSEI